MFIHPLREREKEGEKKEREGVRGGEIEGQPQVIDCPNNDDKTVEGQVT